MQRSRNRDPWISFHFIQLTKLCGEKRETRRPGEARVSDF
jgi:hypothetical protein